MQKSSAPNFDLLAKPYRWMEYASFGRLLETCRFHFLPACDPARRALVLGDGDGRFTQRLLKANPSIEIDAVDASPRMLEELRRRAVAANSGAGLRVRTFRADIRNFIPEPRAYDLVVSHFFLDCLTQDEVAALVARLQPSMAPDAVWLISDFAVPARGWRRAAAHLLIRSLYFAFFLLTRLRVQHLPDHVCALEHAGFSRLRQKTFLDGLLFTELWRMETTDDII